MIAVIKADGYGHGAESHRKSDHMIMIISGDLQWLQQRKHLQLRHAGMTKPILILGIVFEEYYRGACCQ